MGATKAAATLADCGSGLLPIAVRERTRKALKRYRKASSHPAFSLARSHYREVLAFCVAVALFSMAFRGRSGTPSDDAVSTLIERYANPPSFPWQRIALTVEAIVDPLSGDVVVPERKIVMTDLAGDCAFDKLKSSAVDSASGTRDGLSGTVCERFQQFEKAGDQYVTTSFLSELPDGCLNGEYVLDFGSNFGYYTSLFRAMGCRVVAVDPQPAMNQFHLAGLDANGWLNDGSVSLIEGFVGTESAMQPLPNDMKFWSPSGWGDANPRGIVQAGTMMRHVDIKELVVCDLESGLRTEFVKLDIDGPEAAIFEDVVQFMVDGCIRAMVTEIRWKTFPRFGASYDKGVELFERLYDNGFNVYHVYPVLDSDEQGAFDLEYMRAWRAFSISKLTNVIHRVPRESIRQVLDAREKNTKNFFITKLE